MVETPNTRASLLIRLRDPRDERAWSEFVDISSRDGVGRRSGAPCGQQ
jgi:hypothetical protein